ncbi:MAG: small subunit ribosomal protein [Bacillota bacterium]|nr:small subunit ribosomal protein [Bacillota bacterium]MDK2882160.1 small subunit ribosomal protein [Bacillota bacterium]MDK2960297.1 small subunit ribosomal protein [Bacillota bacterium]
MAVRIRLRRMGAKKAPFYRLVVADSRMPRDGRFVESIGYYNPTKDPAVIEVDEEKALTWLSRGAQPSETALKLLKKVGIWEKFTEAKAKGQEVTQG